MRRSKAKERVLKVSEEMFSKVGYGALNVNNVAAEAGVSIGTLYYHFPEGKLSILMEIRRRISGRYEKIFKERLGENFLEEAGSFDEGLSALIDVLIAVHREERLVLAAMESEVLSNLTIYDEIAGDLDVEALIAQDTEPVVDVIEGLLSRYPVNGLGLSDNGSLISKVIDALIHKFVYLEQIFSTEKTFKEMLTKIIYALLRK
jgi:AcrR family transcriptional regulator